MSKINLLEETLDVLKKHGKKESDVKWAGSREVKTSWRNFKKIANFEYDNGYGRQRIAPDLLIVGIDFWLSRREYDGSEWWDINTFPEEPSKRNAFKFVDVDRSLNAGIEFYAGEATLKNINGL